MKKLLVVLGLAMAFISFQASAATFTINDLTDLSSNSGTNLAFDSNIHNTAGFSNTWEFTTDADTVGHVMLTANPDFAFSVDFFVNGILTAPTFVSAIGDKVFNYAFLSTEVYTFVATGGRGNIDLSVQAVPVPAAVWLFGSALMGLMGVSRRKTVQA